MSAPRLIPQCQPKRIDCTLCARAHAAGPAAKSNQRVSQASVACLACHSYQCARCDAKAHGGADNKAHVRYPVSQLKSYIDFSQPPRAGESAPRSHLGSQGVALDIPFGDCTTLYGIFWRSVRLHGDESMLGARTFDAATNTAGPYKFQTYKEVGARVHNLGAALRALGLEAQSRVGLYSANRPEWVIGEQACFTNNLVTVPLYDTLGPESAEQIVSQATLQAVICSADKVASLVAIAQRHPCLRVVIVMPPQPFEAKATAAAALSQASSSSSSSSSSLRVMSLAEAEQLGAQTASTFTHTPPVATDFCTFCYTSGTTGAPKGAMLQHRAVLNDVTAVSAHAPRLLIQERERHISYLPLAHMFERLVLSSIIAYGGAVGFSRGNPLLLLEDIEALKPTTFAGVPRLYNRLYDKVLAMINQSSPVKRWLFHHAYNAKLANLRATGSVVHPLWDRLVFSKVAAKLGGNVRIMVTGSAPIADNVMQFLRICFSCSVVEGYGQTESTAASTLTMPSDDRSFGNVGTPLVCNLVKLVDVPEMQYTANDMVNGAPCPRGEVCFKGTNIFSGYYQDPENTAAALDKDGWLHSGDIGMWLPDQTLKLIDRKKNIFKTAQGEYIAPEKIENTYQRCKYIAQSFVHGDGLESTLVAVIVPDEEELTAWAQKEKVAFASFADLVANPLVKQLILDEMNQVAKEAQLKGFEMVKNITLSPALFSVENDLLTPTFKLKRNVAQKVFAKEIATMYGHGEAKPTLIQSKL